MPEMKSVYVMVDIRVRVPEDATGEQIRRLFVKEIARRAEKLNFDIDVEEEDDIIERCPCGAPVNGVMMDEAGRVHPGPWCRKTPPTTEDDANA